MTMVDLTFADAEAPFDSVPPLADVEHPCDRCGKETGWSGRGRKKKLCDDCRPARRNASAGVKVTGNAANLAAQATKTLASINAMFAMGFGGMGFFRTMSIVMEKNEDFETAAYAALITDPKMCQQILGVGQASSKLGLGLAYVSLGMGIAPTIAEELREKKAARLVEMDV
jgi:hypothetical protein